MVNFFLILSFIYIYSAIKNKKKLKDLNCSYKKMFINNNNSLIKFIVYSTILLLSKAQDCIIKVPNDPLNSGLFENWILSTQTFSDVPCTQTDPGANVFIEATILNIYTGELFVYFPLVVDIGSTPAAPALKGNITTLNHIVTIHFGSNGNSITLLPTIDYSINSNSLISGNCVNGLQNGSIFGQFAYCNAEKFFKRVNEMIINSPIKIPELQNSPMGDVCPTTRSFGVIDQDQSDNVLSQYLLLSDNTVSQDYKINKEKFPNFKILGNGSDNRLLNNFINVAIGCQSFTAPDLVDNTILRSSLALNEIQANLLDNNLETTALVPSIDPMVLDNNIESLEKLNLYRIGVNQPLLISMNISNNILYCKQLITIAPVFLNLHKDELSKKSSPDSNIASNLLNFLANRFINSLMILNCQNLTGLTSPISVIFNENGIVTSSKINISPQPTTCCLEDTTTPIPTQTDTTTSVTPTQTYTTPSVTLTQIDTTPSATPTQTDTTSSVTTPTQIDTTPSVTLTQIDTTPSATQTQTDPTLSVTTTQLDTTTSVVTPTQTDTTPSVTTPTQTDTTSSVTPTQTDTTSSVTPTQTDPTSSVTPTQTDTTSSVTTTQTTEICCQTTPKTTSSIPSTTYDTTKSPIVNTTTSKTIISPTISVNSTIMNLCGTSAYNVNCTQPCNIDSDCKIGFLCYKVNIQNLSICNFNNFCGTYNEQNVKCNKQCPNGIDLDCDANTFCFKETTNFCNQVPDIFKKYLPTTEPPPQSNASMNKIPSLVLFSLFISYIIFFDIF